MNREDMEQLIEALQARGLLWSEEVLRNIIRSEIRKWQITQLSAIRANGAWREIEVK